LASYWAGLARSIGQQPVKLLPKSKIKSNELRLTSNLAERFPKMLGNYPKMSSSKELKMKLDLWNTKKTRDFSSSK
jgi:hypothetical protein